MPQSTRPRILKRLGVISLMTLTALLLGACASTPEAPPASLTEARDAIATAEQSDARQYASSELDEAIRKLALAENAISSEELLDAEQFANESRITAELALAKTTAAKADEINRQMIRDADALDEEMSRTGDQR